MQEVIKLNNGYSFYLRWLSVLPDNFNPNQQQAELLDSLVKDRVEVRKKYLMYCEDGHPLSLSIAPTGYCEGRCKYCYAKEFYNEKDYLTVDKLEAFIKKYNINLSKGNVIIYGGEPVLNFEPFKQLIEYLYPKCKYICVVTSLFYNDEIYNKLKDLLRKYERITLSVSMDNPHDNQRIYTKVEDSHKFTFNRYIELCKEFKYQISTRATINTGKDYWKWINSVRDLLGYSMPCNCDWSTVSEDEDMSKFIEEFNKYIDKIYIEDGDEFFYNDFYSFDTYDTFIGVTKGCDVNMSRYAVNHKGKRIRCVDNLFSTDIPKTDKEMSDYIYNTNNEICKDCNLKNICLSKCFYVFNKNVCKWMEAKFLKWLEIKSRTQKGLDDLFNKSLIKLNNK